MINNTNDDEVIDDSVFRHQHIIKDNIVTQDEFNAWISSPMTKALLDTLDYYCITVAARLEDNGDVNMQLLGQFDIKKGILKRNKSK